MVHTRTPYGSMIDDQFGQSFLVVREVYNELAAIRFLASNMGAVRNAANNIRLSTIALTVALPLTEGEQAFIDLPDGITNTAISDFSVILEDVDETLYAQASGFFTAVLTGAGVLVVALTPEAPVSLLGGTVHAKVTYQI